MLKTLFHDGRNVLSLAHSVKMDCRDAMLKEILALLHAPVETDFVDSILVIAGMSNSLCQDLRDIQRERLRKQLHLLGSGQRLQTRNDRDIDPCLTALTLKPVENFIVEKHLGDHIVGTCIHLTLQILNVGLDIGCLEMLLRISTYTDAERLPCCLLVELADS